MACERENFEFFLIYQKDFSLQVFTSTLNIRTTLKLLHRFPDLRFQDFHDLPQVFLSFCQDF